MADPIQIPHGVLSPVTRHHASTRARGLRWWALAAVVFLLIYGTIFALIAAFA
jgi:hypothetical protein